jgi:hypothetical protein
MAVLRRAGRLSGRDVRAAEAATADLQHDGWTVLADTVVPVPLPADSAADLRELASDLGLSLADMDQLLGIGPAAFGGLVSVAWSWRLVVAERRSA